LNEFSPEIVDPNCVLSTDFSSKVRRQLVKDAPGLLKRLGITRRITFIWDKLISPYHKTVGEFLEQVLPLRFDFPVVVNNAIRHWIAIHVELTIYYFQSKIKICMRVKEATQKIYCHISCIVRSDVLPDNASTWIQLPLRQ